MILLLSILFVLVFFLLLYLTVAYLNSNNDYYISFPPIVFNEKMIKLIHDSNFDWKK